MDGLLEQVEFDDLEMSGGNNTGEKVIYLHMKLRTACVDLG